MKCTNCDSEISKVYYLLYDSYGNWERTKGSFITICSECKSKNRNHYKVVTSWSLFILKGEKFIC